VSYPICILHVFFMTLIMFRLFICSCFRLDSLLIFDLLLIFTPILQSRRAGGVRARVCPHPFPFQTRLLSTARTILMPAPSRIPPLLLLLLLLLLLQFLIPIIRRLHCDHRTHCVSTRVPTHHHHPHHPTANHANNMILCTSNSSSNNYRRRRPPCKWSMYLR
jgi:hypothetical protein